MPRCQRHFFVDPEYIEHKAKTQLVRKIIRKIYSKQQLKECLKFLDWQILVQGHNKNSRIWTLYYFVLSLLLNFYHCLLAYLK